jgi:hypothetical protein
MLEKRTDEMDTPHPAGERAPATAPTADHAHRWRIDEPTGPFSAGRCSACGVEREFRNWLEALDFTVRDEHATERREAA